MVDKYILFGGFFLPKILVKMASGSGSEEINREKSGDKAKNFFNRDSEGTDEDNLIKENCDYITKFLANLKECDLNNVSSRSKLLLGNLAESFKNIQIGAPNKSETKVNNEQSDSDLIRKNKVQKKKDGSKPREKLKQVKMRRNDSSDSYSSEISSDSAGSSNSNSGSSSMNPSHSSCARRKIKQKRRIKNFTDIMAKFDNRKIPRLEKFDENSGQALKEYLERFERYCKDNFKRRQSILDRRVRECINGKHSESIQVYERC